MRAGGAVDRCVLGVVVLGSGTMGGSAAATKKALSGLVLQRSMAR